MQKQYFHLITEWEWENMRCAHFTWQDIRKRYKQPNWCRCPAPIDPLGCWGLIFFDVDPQGEYCQSCEFRNINGIIDVCDECREREEEDEKNWY